MEQREEEPFNMIILDLKYQNLYSSWEESLFESIDDYKNSKGEITPAEKTSFIKSPPGTLFFQLQRVVFDKEKGITKINDKFTFEKEIFIDRALDENQNFFLKIREKVKNLKVQKRSYEEALQKIKNFNNSNINLVSILAQSKEFLTAQTFKPIDIEGNTDLVVPTYFGTSNPEELLHFGLILEQYRHLLEKRVDELEFQLNALNHEIEESYAGLKKIKYRLLSIMIHEGNAEYGHYYSYILDFGQNLWRKFNDTHVVVVGEDEVMKDALGGSSHVSAYCLIYVLDSLCQDQHPNFPVRLNTSFEDGAINDQYTHFLSETSIFKEIETDNLKFIQEVEEYTARMKIKTIFDDYQREFQYINEIERKLKERIEKSENKKILITPLLNFSVFLRFHPGNKDRKYENLVNFSILNHCFSLSCPDLKSLENFDQFPVFWQEKLIEQLKKLSANTYKAVDLKVDMNLYNKLMREFVEMSCYVSISIYFLKKAIEGNFRDSLFAAVNLKQNLESSANNQFFMKVEGEFLKIISLFFCTRIHELLKTEKSNEIKETFSLLNLISSNHINDPDLLLQLKVWLTVFQELAEKYTKNEDILAFLKQGLEEFGKKKASFAELGIEEPKDFSLMLNQNAIDNDPLKIDTFKETDSLCEVFFQNFQMFKTKYDKWCQAIKSINLHFKNCKVPLMRKDLENLGVF